MLPNDKKIEIKDNTIPIVSKILLAFSGIGTPPVLEIPLHLLCHNIAQHRIQFPRRTGRIANRVGVDLADARIGQSCPQCLMPHKTHLQHKLRRQLPDRRLPF